MSALWCLYLGLKWGSYCGQQFPEAEHQTAATWFQTNEIYTVGLHTAASPWAPGSFCYNLASGSAAHMPEPTWMSNHWFDGQQYTRLHLYRVIKKNTAWRTFFWVRYVKILKHCNKYWFPKAATRLPLRTSGTVAPVKTSWQERDNIISSNNNRQWLSLFFWYEKKLQFEQMLLQAPLHFIFQGL